MLKDIVNRLKAFVRRRKIRRVQVEDCTVELEQKFREIAAVHYKAAGGCLSLDAEWLGWGKDQTMYLSVKIPLRARFRESGPDIPSERLAPIAARIFDGLKQLGIPSQILRLETPILLSEEARKATLSGVEQEMRSLGWELTFDRSKGVMQQNRIPGEFRRLTSEEIARMAQLQAKAAECIRGHRTSYKVMFQSPGLPMQ